MTPGATDPPDAMIAAIATVLRGVGAPLGTDPELAGTPERVAAMYRDELLDGYGRDVRAILGEALASDERGLVVVTGIRYASMCPHHMLPALGRAHVAYLPNGRVVGLGTIVRLVDALAHRLVLQEALGRQIADALVEHLGARGAAVMLRARHRCMAARGERQTGAALVTMAFAGSMARENVERDAFLRALPAAKGTRRGR